MPMPGFSLHPPPLASTSPSPCCCSCGPSPFPHPPLPADDDLRRLLDRIPSSLLSSPGSDELVWQFLGYGDDGAAQRPLCPGLKNRVHALVHKLLSERAAAGSLCGGNGGGARTKLGFPASRKRKRDVQGLLEWVRDAARDPVELSEEARRWRKPILNARKVMFEKVDEEVEAREFHFCSKRRRRNFTEESHKKVLDQPKRRSERIANNAYLKIQHLLTLRKRIGVGPTFQADIPDWTGPVTDRDISDYKVDVDTVKWLGTQVRPADVDESSGISELVVGKGRPRDCTCSSPGSKTCILTHVRTARLQLRADLGQFFTHWGFDSMGEGILESWGEEKNFAALDRLTGESNSTSFWKIVSKHFSPKSKSDLVNYYFNVFVLRKIGNQSRQAHEDIHTDEEDDYEEEEQEDRGSAHLHKKVNAHVESSSISFPTYSENISFSSHSFFS